jgi:hypothetical protein
VHLTRVIVRLGPGEDLRPIAFPDVSIPVAEVLV